jgi:hypothetical protein
MAAMPDPTPAICSHCGTTHQVHQHSVSVDNTGALPCPVCGNELVRWAGKVFYTLAVVNPRSASDLAAINDDEQAGTRPRKTDTR